MLGEHAQRAARTYGAAADHFTLAPLNFWDRLGAATVARLPLATGDTVLDLCCGAGASAIPAVVGEIEPSLVKAYQPWDKLTGPAALAGLFTRAGASEPAVTDVPGQHRLDRPEDFWDVVLGSGYRATVDALSPRQRGRLHDRLLGELRSAAVTYIRTDAVFGAARKPV